MFQNVLVHHQEQLYKLYIPFRMVPAYTSIYQMRCTAYKVAPDDGLIQSEICRASNVKIKSNHKNFVHLFGSYTYYTFIYYIIICKTFMLPDALVHFLKKVMYTVFLTRKEVRNLRNLETAEKKAWNLTCKQIFVLKRSIYINRLGIWNQWCHLLVWVGV